VPFTVSRLTEFCSRKELVNQTGYEFRDWPLVIIKELIDNSLDSAEEVGVAPSILVEISGDVIAVTDNGPGIPASIIEQVLNYAIRVSSREAYVSPTRGAQGNALKTILPMGYVLSEHLGEDASGETIIEAHGVAHHIRFSVDHIKQEPKIAHTTETSSLPSGTRIRAKLPKPKVYEYENENYFDDLIADSRDSIIRLVESYAWINPHLTLQLIWNGENVIDIKASNPDWKKWLPTWPTSPHWYDLGRFRRYMAAHISNRPSITVREFISEFDGMTSTAKQKLVLAETGASHMSLHNYFGLHKANIENIAKLLASLKAHSKPVKPEALGIIGKEHLFRMFEASGGEPATFKYTRTTGVAAGIPRVIEVAFGIHRDGLTAAGRVPAAKSISGVNWSPGIHNPFRQLGHNGVSLDAILSEVRASASQPVIVALHVAMARVAYLDRGKTRIVIEGEGVTEKDNDE